MSSNSFQRWTRQRVVILEELCKLRSHPTAGELHEIVRRRLPKVSLGTVYRNLDVLAGIGAVRKLELGGGEARFDGNVGRHDHVRCVECGRVEDTELPPLELVNRGAQDAGGYRILDYRLEYVGICPECQQRSKRK